MRKIAVITGTRAEYGILRNTLYEIEKSKILDLNLIIMGTHLSKKYGHTIDEIKADGFKISYSIPSVEEREEKIRIPIEMGKIMSKLAYCLLESCPDVILLLGDRYEMLASAAVAVGMNIPIAHISGGESTEGVIDEQIRHAITKMAHIHFPGASIYAENIKNMGEEAWRIFEVGDPGIENIKKMKFYKKNEIENMLQAKIDKSTLLVTYHPVTLELNSLEYQVENLILALKRHNGVKIITFPNSDTGGEYIIEKLQQFAKEDKSVRLAENLGSKGYLSVMKYCGAVVGNSSSAIVETPFMKIPTVNIGNRQKGRLMADSIINCDYEEKSISDAIRKALSSDFEKVVHRSNSLYGDGNTSVEIVKVLEEIELGGKILKKKLEWENK